MEKTHSKAACTISNEEAAKRRALFAKYVEPYLRMVYKLCIQYTFCRDNIQDNYIEVLTNIYKYIESYDNTRPIRTWLHIVTKRCVYDLDKKRKKISDTRNNDKSIDMILPEEILDDSDEISGNVMGIENYRELYSDDVLYALDQLKPSYRRALLYQQAGYKLKEIVELEYKNGALDSKKIDTIKSRLFWARHAMKQMLTRDGERRKTDQED